MCIRDRIEAARSGMPEEDRKRIFDFMFTEVSGQRMLPLVGALLIETLARGVGILSLTEKADNLLMWAHYAQSHEGFVIGFNMRDPFFSRPDARKDALHDLRKVRYSTRRPQLKFLTELSLLEMYFTKGKEWKYEQEWRMYTTMPELETRSALESGLRSITQSGSVTGLQPCQVNLFDFPATCVNTIIVGCRASGETHKTISSVVAEKYPHALILNATISSIDFALAFSRAS